MLIRQMPSDPVERAGAVAADYEALQGLITVGTGIGLILMTTFDTPAFGAIVVGAAGAIGQGYYYQKYGKVRQTSGQVWAAVAVAIIVVLVACAGIIVDAFAGLPIMLGPLTGALGLFVFCLLNYRHVGVTRIHLAVVAVLPFGALLPLTGLVTDHFWTVDLWLLGLAWIVIGLGDHRRLTGVLKPAADE